jgi:hypothetical protein
VCDQWNGDSTVHDLMIYPSPEAFAECESLVGNVRARRTSVVMRRLQRWSCGLYYDSKKGFFGSRRSRVQAGVGSWFADYPAASSFMTFFWGVPRDVGKSDVSPAASPAFPFCAHASAFVESPVVGPLALPSPLP